MRLLPLLLLLTACGKPDPEPSRELAPDEARVYYESASARLVSMLDRGFVVSRYEDGTIEHKGDALIWTGLALAFLPTDSLVPVASGILGMIDAKQGGFYRHPDLPDDLSWDGAVGVYRGMAREPWRWAAALSQHVASSNVPYPEGFDYVPKLALAVATDGARPDPSGALLVNAAVTAWAAAVNAEQAACYRVNLGYHTLRTIEILGQPIDWTPFCEATVYMGLSMVDWRCGRGNLREWIKDFRYDIWETQHQRCPAWEDPDGREGLRTPGLDLIEALKEEYAL